MYRLVFTLVWGTWEAFKQTLRGRSSAVLPGAGRVSRLAIGPRATYTPRPMTRIFLLLSGWLALWLALAAPLGALEIRETLWGFDGAVVPNRFHPLSVLVENPDGRTFDGNLTLFPSDGAGNRRGAEYVQPLFLAPRTTRWVQFQVFIGNYLGNFSLAWGDGPRARLELPNSPKHGPPACVWLRDTGDTFARGGLLKTFPEALFPTTLAATDALDAVVLDHAPNWEPARRAAFRLWLARGGTVHLLRDRDGRFPQVTDELTALNNPEADARIDRGRVVRHEVGPREMSAQYLAARGFPARTLVTTQNPLIHDFDAVIFRRLASLTRPVVNWPAIHLLGLAYIAVIGPLHFRFRRRFDYRVSIAAFLVTVALFSTAFAVIGRRGYGESQTVHSLAIARALGGGQCDVTQWISAFATDGDLYTLTHQAPANLYATEQNSEAGGGRIFNGKDGRLLLDIPLYSSRTFLHRSVMPGDDPAVTAEQWTEGAEQRRTLRLRPGPGFPKEFSDALVVQGGRVYELTSRDGALVADNQSGQLLSERYSRAVLQPLTYQHQFRDVTKVGPHRELMPLLAARVVQPPEILQNVVAEPAPASDRALLLVVAPAPPAFRLQGQGFGRELGWVLYVQDFSKP